MSYRARLALATAATVMLGLLTGIAATASTDPAHAFAPSPTRLVSATADGAPSSVFASDSDVSGDGHYVVFTAGGNLSNPASTVRQIYRKDTITGDIVVVSAKANGQAGTSDSARPSISDDGRFVAFESSSLNFGASDPRVPQVFVRDLQAGGSGLTMLSRNPATGQPANDSSTEARISGDGSHVAFESRATDLATGVPVGRSQVYVASVDTSVAPPIRVASLQDSAFASSPTFADEGAVRPSISSNGSVVVFSSVAKNLSADTVAHQQVWRHEMSTGRTQLISRAVTGGGGDDNSMAPDVSGDGRYVTFSTEATNLDSRGSSKQNIYLYDVQLQTSALITANRQGGYPVAPELQLQARPEISADGLSVVFVSYSSDLTVGHSTSAQVFVRDVRTKTTTMVSTKLVSPNDSASTGAITAAISADGNTVVFESPAEGLTADTVPGAGVSEVYMRDRATASVDRLGGADRFDVAAGVSAAIFGTEREVVYVASGADFADALSASAAAGSAGGPVLLVTRDGIPNRTGAQLARLRPEQIVIVGGPNSVSVDLESTLRGFAGRVDRIGGPDRYAVSAGVAASAFPSASAGTVYLASGAVFPDALAGAAATHGLGPVLLVTKDSVPDSVRAQLTRLAPSAIVVLGGPNTISDAMLDSLPKSATVTRLGGSDRYAVSANASARSFEAPVDVAYVASGAVFPDALSGSAAAIAAHAPVLLVSKDSVPDSVAAELGRLKPRRIVVLGGPATVSDAVQAQLAGYLATG